MAVNKDRVRLFVAALRSGEYEQGRGALQRALPFGEQRFCCLGVACEVAIREGVPVTVTSMMGDGHKGYIQYDNTGSWLPASVQGWYGFDASQPYVLDDAGEWVGVIELNDGLCKKFPYIADAFERTYLEGDDDGQP
jgi:hypothetical protein